MPPPLLAISDLRLTMGSGPGIEASQLAIAARRSTVVLMPAASGRSALAHLLAGLPMPHPGVTAHGTASFDGAVATAVTHCSWRAWTSLVPHNYFQFLTESRMSDELIAPLEVRAVPFAEAEARIRNAAKLLEIGHLLDRNPLTLSGGEIQRLAIGVALASQPRLLVLDEPFAELDSNGMAILERLLIEDIPAAGTATCVIGATVTERLLGASNIYALGERKLTPVGHDSVPTITGDRAYVHLLPALETLTPIDTPRDGTAPSVPSQEAASFLEIRDLTFRYPRQAKPALSEVSIRFHRGQSIGITGPNGSGKSTLLAVLLGFEGIPGDALRIDGLPATSARLLALRGRAGVLFQTYHHHFLSDTARQELAAAAAVSSHVVELDALAERLQLTPWLDVVIDTLPGQVRRLLGFTTALLLATDLLILDEPTAELDGIGRQLLLAELDRIRRTLLVLIVSHDRTFLEQACLDELALRDGRVEFAGPVRRMTP